MPKKIIHINKSVIGQNVKDDGHRPTITVKQSGKPARYCRGVSMVGPSRLVQSDKPLSCGARVWIETEDPIILTDPMTHTQAQSVAAAAAPTGKPKQEIID